MKSCAECGSYAINHHLHGRDGTRPELCDVCYWQTKAEEWRRDAERFRYLRDFPPRRRAQKDGNTQPSLNDMWAAAFLNPAPGTIPTMDILEGDELDRRLDAAIDAARKEGGK